MYDNVSLLYTKDDVFGIEEELQPRLNKLNKLVSVFGKSWFKGKSILELGCGGGHIGLYLQSLGADVFFTDSRDENLDIVRKKNYNSKTILLDQDKFWNLERKFDLAVHFGLLYNLNHWRRDLFCTVLHSKFIALETGVAKYKNNFEVKIIPSYKQQQHGPSGEKGTLVSPKFIENILTESNCSFTRYMDSEMDKDLSHSSDFYRWDENEIYYGSDPVPVNSWWDNDHVGGRGFWVIKTNANKIT